MTIATDTRPRRRSAIGAFVAAVVTRAAAGLLDIREQQEAMRAVHRLGALSDHQLRDLGLHPVPMELLVRGLSFPRSRHADH
jgi:uncharacterized protein YjiS (DUF1127 family)